MRYQLKYIVQHILTVKMAPEVANNQNYFKEVKFRKWLSG